MAGPGPVLREAHRLRQHIQGLEARIAQAPRQLQIQKAKLQSAENNLKQAQDEIKQLKVKTHDREGTVKAAFVQIAKWEKQREGVENKKEFEALNHEIADAQGRIKALEDEIFELMTLTEEKAAQLPATEAITKQVRADVAQFEKEYDDRLAKFEAERAAAAAELANIDAQIPEDLVPMYQKVIKGRGADALARIEGRVCTVCNTELTPQNASEVKRGMFVLCKSCGRIMYA
jgi:predicted  nucleic acid-binding Zn-ribbon protein